MSRVQQIHSLQILRGLAAIAVVHAHTITEWEALTGTPTRDGWHTGAVGVDIFFVISGFIITQTATRAGSGWAFFVRRWQRVAPLYWLLSLPWLLFVSGDGFLGRLRSTLTFVPVSEGEPLLPLHPSGWTLCFEMLFYSAIAFAVGRGPRTWSLATALLLAAIAAQTLVGGPILAFIGNPILVEFLFGAALAWLWRLRWPLAGLSAIGAALTVLAVISFTGAGDIHEGRWTFDASLSWPRVVLFGLPALGLVWGALQLDSPPLARWSFFGDASYSIYLTHLIVLFGVTGVWRVAALPVWIYTPTAMAIAIVGGCVCYERIEKPLLQYVRKQMPQPAVT